MIQVILGKRGSGKSTLSKELLLRTGGRVIYLSPVEKLRADYTVWKTSEIQGIMKNLKKGEIALIRRADLLTAEYLAASAIAYNEPEKGKFTLVIDEMERYAKSQHLLDIIHYGRHFHIELIANSRRYTDLPRLLTSQADYLYIFRTVEPRDLQYVAEYAGTKARDIVQKLEKFEYYVHPTEDIRQTKRILELDI